MRGKRNLLRSVVAGVLLAVCLPSGASAAAELAHGLCVQLLRAPHDPEVTDLLRAAIGRLEDDADKARYGAVYTLSLLTKGHAAGPGLQAHMIQNFSASPYTRLVAPAYVSHICTACDGTLTVGTACSRCSGSGQCSSCRGSGRSRVSGFDGAANRCMTCQGTGHCPDCNGSGFVDAVCRACQDGFVPSPVRAEASYYDLLLHIVEGTGLPEVLRAVSVRAVLEAGDEVAGPATQTTDQVIREGVAARVRERFAYALAGGVVTVQGTIVAARPLDDARASVRLDGIDQFAPARRADQHLHVLPWNTVVVTSTPREAEVLRGGETLRIIGPVSIVPVQPGHAEFPEGVLQVATVWVQADATSRLLVGTLVMPEGIVGVGGRLFRLAP